MLSWFFRHLHISLLRTTVFTSGCSKSVTEVSSPWHLRFSNSPSWRAELLFSQAESPDSPRASWSLVTSEEPGFFSCLSGAHPSVLCPPHPGFVDCPPNCASCFPLLMSFLLSCLGTPIFPESQCVRAASPSCRHEAEPAHQTHGQKRETQSPSRSLGLLRGHTPPPEAWA